MSNYSFLDTKDNKQCFCIDATAENVPYILDNLKIQLAEQNLIQPVSAPEAAPIDHAYDYLLTPQIHDVINVDPNKQKVLSAINNIMENALNELNKPKDVVVAANEKVDVAPRDSMTIERDTDDEIDPNDDVDLNKMARTTNNMQRKAGDFKLFEDFNTCDTVCSKSSGKKSLFEMDETKYILIIATLLFLCSVIFRK